MIDRIDLNCDMGESYGRFKIGNDKLIMPFISSANIACGFHGGDPDTIIKTIRLAIDNDVKIGAHPSYPDLMGFGRNVMELSRRNLKAILSYQICAVKGLTESLGKKLNHVKPHGALYNAAIYHEPTLYAIIEAIQMIDPSLKLVGIATSSMKRTVEKEGLQFIGEVFSDRNYNDNGSLVPRSLPNAIITNIDESIDHVLRILLQNEIHSINGKIIPVHADTICIHGDHSSAYNYAKNISKEIKNQGIQIRN